MKILNNLSVFVSIFLLGFCFYQYLQICNYKNKSEFHYKDSEFWHSKYLRQKIHGDE